jgi:hypothetical protein
VKIGLLLPPDHDQPPPPHDFQAVFFSFASFGAIGVIRCDAGALFFVSVAP